MKSPLISRYYGLSEPSRILDLVTVLPPVLVDLQDYEIRAAAKRLEDRLKAIYIPNDFSLEFIAEFVESSASFCIDKYPDQAAYMRSIFHPSTEETIPICLTGLAGVGKSALLNALRRLLPPPISYSVPSSSLEVNIVSHWSISARDNYTTKQLLIDLLSSGGTHPHEIKGAVSELQKAARRYAGKVGLPLIILDELQHKTFSSTATAAVTSQLLALAKIGVPMVYVCNYSLLHKLFRRNSEEKQRLLPNPRIMMPDTPDSQDWFRYIEECRRVTVHLLDVDSEVLSDFLYFNTFGLKRFVVKLFGLAYIESRRRGSSLIQFEDFISAQISAEYTVERNDVVTLARQEYEHKLRREDLWCPYEIPVVAPTKLVEHYKEMDKRRFAQVELEKALTPPEKSAYKLFERADDPTPEKTSIKKNRRKSVSLESLRDSHNSYVKKGE